ncbi:MAG: HAMP domain-containing protein [Elusimicrobia bacterium]|nr:HAMP domain-containing protein [Elusimicrobiota bacterium]
MPTAEDLAKRLRDFWNRIPLAKQLFLAMFFPTWLMISIYFLYDVRATTSRLLGMERSAMETMAPVLSGILEDSMLRGAHGHIRYLFSGPRDSSEGQRILLLDAEGRAVDPAGLGIGRPLRRFEPPALDPKAYLTMDFPLRAKPACAACHGKKRALLGGIRISLPHEERVRTIAAHFKSHLVIFCLSMSLMLLWALAIVRWMIQAPLDRVSLAMEQVAAGRFDTTIKDVPSGELQAIATGFNTMVRQIGKDRREIVELHQRQVAHLDRLATMGELAAHLAHEVRNPLTGIGAALQVLERETSPGSPRRELLGKVLGQLNRMDQTMANFLQYARMPAAVIRPFAAREPLNRILAIIEPRLRSQKISLQRRLPEQLPLIVGDPGQIEQVFLNVCLNAVQAMPEGGTLTVSARREGNDRVLMEFADTGRGIPPEHLEEVFQPFFTTNEKGSGLGLPICRQLLMAQGGDIRLQSAVGKGTSVFITLPAPNRGWD